MDKSDQIDLEASRYQFKLDESELSGKSFPIIDASVRTTKALSCLKNANIDTIIRYYCSDPMGSWKVIAPAEAKAIIAEGLKLCIVQEASSKEAYFSFASGKLDGAFSCKYGKEVIGQPHGSAIYFAIDFDATKQALKDRIIPYFKGVAEAVKAVGSPYKIGVYGSGRTCQALLTEKLVEFTWLAQSTGWSGYEDFKASKKWALLQKPTAHSCEIEVDFDEASVADFGAFSTLDAVKAADEVETYDVERASSKFDGLEEDFKARAILLIKECADQKIKMVPYFGVRSPHDQAVLWRQSRSAAEIAAGVKKLRDGGAPWLAGVLEKASGPSGKQVTKALPGMSWHQWGQALDCYREINGKPDWDDKKYVEYAKLAETKEIGLTSGSHFSDWDHVQLSSDVGPQIKHSYAYIDDAMKKKWGSFADGFEIATRTLKSEETNTADVIKAIISVLREATSTEIKIAGDQRPYFFPNGIFKIDVALGLLVEPPSGEGNDVAPTPGISARIIISGSEKA